MKTKWIVLSISMALFLACSEEGGQQSHHSSTDTDNGQPLFELLSEEESGISFRNDIMESPEVHGLVWDAIYYGGGVGIGDINNDGLDDIFLAGNQVNDALYVNQGDLQFEDISAASGITDHPGWSTGVSMIDINADGLLDIYVCRTSWKMDNNDPGFRKNKLFINNGDLTFSEKSNEYGLDYAGYSTQAAFLDFDKDGDLDLFLLNSPSNNLTQKVQYAAVNKLPEFTSDLFYINNGKTFENVTKQVGVEAFSFGLGVMAADLNHDTWVDIYVANDYDRPDYMYINQRDGTFKNQLDEKIKHTSFTSMGCDAADINNDGLVDLGVLDMQSADHVRSKTNMPSMDAEQFWGYVNKGYNYQYMTNVLQINNGSGYFSDIAQYAGVASSDWSWAILMADFDNDQHKDIFVGNGINKDLRNNDFKVKMEGLTRQNKKVNLFELSKEIPSNPLPNYVYRNDGKYHFENVTGSWGLDQKTFTCGAAYSDLDRDGDLDLVVNNNNDRSFIYRNNSKSNYVVVDIKGYAKNPAGIGSKVFLFQGDQIQYQELNPVRGYQSTCGTALHFGLGDHSTIDSLVCIFPDDKSIRLYNIKSNKRIALSHADASNQQMSIYSFETPVVMNQPNSGIDFMHRENLYDDFKDEILLPHAESTKGPYQCVGDVNGDGLDDLFIGGASGQSGELYVQNAGGRFSKMEGPWRQHAGLEDMGCAFFDLEGDGDLDLYVASGGNASADPHAYHDRLYRNDGGRFSLTSGVLPELHANSSCVSVADYDGDGDTDIFVGGLVEYGRYPYPGQSVLLRNEGGKFIDVTKEISGSLQDIGMVTGATWTDINADKKPDLILVGEWMAPTAFINDGNTFEEKQNWVSDQGDLTGWWMHIVADDLNGDGKPDFIVGNIGTNNKYHPSTEKPLKVYSSDFDENNKNDIVLAKKYKGNYVPVRGRECSSEQMPFVAEKFETYEAFAGASIESMLEEKLAGALALEVREFRSGVILSTKTGYHFQPFPPEAQFFPVMTSLPQDFNGDNISDIILAGNLFDAEVETTRHDSGNGLYLQGQPDDHYKAFTVLNSGFYAPFNVRSLTTIKTSQGQLISVGANNNMTTVFKFR